MNRLLRRLIYNLLAFPVLALMLLAPVLAGTSLYDYYQVAVVNDADYYPFGREDLSLYYASPAVYSYIILAQGVISVAVTVCLYYGVFRRRLKFIVAGVALGLLVLALNYLYIELTL